MSQSVYPHTCKLCHAPARIGTVTLCSRSKCKANKSYMKLIRSIKHEFKSRDEEQYLICSICGDRADGASSSNLEKMSSQKISCYNGHTWEFDVQLGDRLYRKDYHFEWSTRNDFYREPQWIITY